ncbi:MAG: tyrosine-type recombinase/integrase [Armatimonadetes bacterium]|nr:tyrosine-type recombinase/integrase [Armatimonadota bacterium]
MARLRLRECVAHFCRLLTASAEYARATARAYSTDLRQFVEFAETHGQATWVTDITPATVEAFKDSLARLKPTTVCRKLAAVSEFFDWLCRQRLVSSNPVAPVKRPKKRSAETVWVTPEDAIALLAACRDDRERAIIATFLRAALRYSELMNLRLQDVDLIRDELHVPGKGGIRRTLPILSDLRPYLVRWLSVRGELDHDFLFTTRTGRPLYRKACWRLFGPVRGKPAVGPESERLQRTVHRAGGRARAAMSLGVQDLRNMERQGTVPHRGGEERKKRKRLLHHRGHT